jgi:hypothetical protein
MTPNPHSLLLLIQVVSENWQRGDGTADKHKELLSGIYHLSSMLLRQFDGIDSDDREFDYSRDHLKLICEMAESAIKDSIPIEDAFREILDATHRVHSFPGELL